MHRMKTMSMTMLGPKEGVVAGGGGGAGDSFGVERLQELLLSLSTLLQKLDRMLPSDDARQARADVPEVIIRLFSILLLVFSLAGLVYYAFFRGDGAWGAAKALKPPRGEPAQPGMFEHECIVTAIGILVFVVLSLGGFYYVYCYKAGCFGVYDGRMVMAPGRKLRVMSR